jgi:hypothetical protein
MRPPALAVQGVPESVFCPNPGFELGYQQLGTLPTVLSALDAAPSKCRHRWDTQGYEPLFSERSPLQVDLYLFAGKDGRNPLAFEDLLVVSETARCR